MRTASDVYALSCGCKNEGGLAATYACHWCGSKCSNELMHDDPPAVPFVKRKSLAKFPANPYSCRGCWLWRRKRIGINYLTGTWGDGRPRDGQSPVEHSWWVTPEAAFTLTTPDFPKLWGLLIKPPRCFVLALVQPPTYHPNGQVDPKSVVGNQLHLAVANDFVKMERVRDKEEEIDVDVGSKIEMGTRLQFTLNNIEHSYSVYELENAFRDGGDGKEPGVQALLKFLGPWPSHLTPKPIVEVKTVDRKFEPPDAKELKKSVEHPKK